MSERKLEPDSPRA